MKLEVGPTHVPKHDGRLNDARVGLNDETVLALLGRRDNQAVRHLAVIPGVLVSGLCRDFKTHRVNSTLPQTSLNTAQPTMCLNLYANS